MYKTGICDRLQDNLKRESVWFQMVSGLEYLMQLPSYFHYMLLETRRSCNFVLKAKVIRKLNVKFETCSYQIGRR